MISKDVVQFVTMIYLLLIVLYIKLTTVEKIRKLENRLKWYEDNLKWEVYKLWRENERENERNKDK